MCGGLGVPPEVRYCRCLAYETCGWNCEWNDHYGGYKAICLGG